MSYDPQNIVITGSSGAIGKAFVRLFSEQYPNATINAFSQNGPQYINYSSEESISLAADSVSKDKPIDIVIVANGILHEGDITPEKSLRDLSADKLHRIFEINAITPILIAKYFLPKLSKHQPSRFAVLSARVGSISDNYLGGWYSYRASKAALNMMIKNAAIEIGRSNHHAVIVGLHPGTVDSNLSRPFQANISKEKIFTPEYSVQKLWGVLEKLRAEDSGKCFAWDNMEILP